MLQEMIIVMTHGQYVPPHRNTRSAKSYVMFSGSFALACFDERGGLVDSVKLAAAMASLPFMARINLPTWHMVIPITPEVVFLETVLGPHEATVYADWAPPADEGERSRAFFRQICEQCNVPLATTSESSSEP